MLMLRAKGIISVEPHKGRIVVNVSDDFVGLYAWFVKKKYWFELQRPLYRSHITVYNSKFHDKVNWKKALQYDKSEVEFDYDEYMIEGGFTKGFIMFYMKIFSDDLKRMKEKLKIDDGSGYRGLHLTIGNSGKSGASPILYWPETIEIR